MCVTHLKLKLSSVSTFLVILYLYIISFKLKETQKTPER